MQYTLNTKYASKTCAKPVAKMSQPPQHSAMHDASHQNGMRKAVFVRCCLKYFCFVDGVLIALRISSGHQRIKPKADRHRHQYRLKSVIRKGERICCSERHTYRITAAVDNIDCCKAITVV